MEQTVYVDLYFLINFSMDLLCFFLTSRLISYPFVPIRALVASAFGGAYACAALFVGIDGVVGLFLDLAACAVMSVIAVKKKGNLKQSAIFALVYAAVSIVLGGFMTALFSLFNRIGLDRLLGSESDSDGISVWLFAVLALISGAVAAFGGRFFKRKSTRLTGEVKIVYGQKSVVLEAMCDSGNMLREPISYKACIVADRETMLKILPSGLVDIVNGHLGARDARGAERVRVIPTRTVNGEGMLYAIRADSVSVNMGRGWCEVDAFVALGEIKKNAQGALALIPSEIVLGAP